LSFLGCGCKRKVRHHRILEQRWKVTAAEIAANFLNCNANIAEGRYEFGRYSKVKAAIENGGGFLSEEQTVDLLTVTQIIKFNLNA